MAHKCAVGGCPNTSDTIIHYILPEEPVRRQKWLEFIKKSKNEKDVPMTSRVCGDHFSEDSFTKLDLGFTTRLILNVCAVPTFHAKHIVEEPEPRKSNENEGENEDSGTRITGIMSLACVKEEECEVDVSASDSGLCGSIKQEQQEHSVTGASHLRILQVRGLKREENAGDHGDQPKAGSDEDDEDGFPADMYLYCPACGEGFCNRGALRQHKLTAHSQEEKVHQYCCTFCDKKFALKAFLNAHLKIHADLESMALFSCPECPRRFQKHSSLKAHVRNHAANSNFPCPVCEELFEHKGTLSQHIRATHVGSRLPCKFCAKRFLKLDSYLKHQDRHTIVTPFYCPSCNVYQLTQRGYHCHMRIHAQRRMLLLQKEEGRKVEPGIHPMEEDDDEEEEEPVDPEADASRDSGMEAGTESIVSPGADSQMEPSEDSGTEHVVARVEPSLAHESSEHSGKQESSIGV